MATSLVADAGDRLLLGNVTSLNDVTAAEQRYKSLQTTLRQSEVVAEVRNVDVTTTVAVLSSVLYNTFTSSAL